MLRLYGTRAAPGRRRLAQRVRLVEHRHRALLRRVLRAGRRTSTGSSRSAASRADEIEQLVETVNERAKPGEIAAIELNASCHNVNFPFETILEESLARAVPRSRHPVILKVSPDEDYGWQARLAEQHGCAGDHGDQHGQGPAPRPRDRRAVAQEPLRRDLGAGDQADRAAGRRRAARRGHPAADHRQRRHPRLRRLPRVLLGRRRRRQPRVGGLAPADAALRAGPGRGPADPPPDLAGGRVHAARRRAALAAGDAEPESPQRRRRSGRAAAARSRALRA